MKLKDLMETRAKTITAMRQIADTPAGQGGELSDEQAHQFDEMRGNLARIEKEIERAEMLDEAERRMLGQTITGTGDSHLDNELRNFSLIRAIASQVPDLAGKVDCGREREMSAEMQRRSGVTAKGMMVPLNVFEQRVTTTTAPVGGPGSNLIATDHLGGQYIDLLRAKLVMRGLGARVLNGLVGNVEIPKLKQSTTSAWIAENGALSASDLEHTKVTMSPKHAGCLTEFSRNMLMQSSPDIEQLIRADFAAVLAEAIDRVAIKGGGSNEPTGILGTSGIGSVAMGTNGGAITWDKVIDLIAELETDNVEGTAFLTNTKVRKSGRKALKVSGDAAGGFIWTEPGSLAGYNAAITNLVPSDGTKGTGTNLSSMIFGNFSDLLIGYWSAFDLLVNPYEATAYAKGNVQVRGMLTMDLAVRHPESFAAITDLVT
ncbi:putative Major capsid protein HK97 [Magnetospirillum sp. XM-1]|uniref:phage major capsid protein n=1 Tax=Magnetospirillum sp. XM-1 TaxID=1663591 RepID=UPI00073E002F|nr:phage major capsid protein [Magnetospirillum sp. XM-1]CUW39291.1 putative Major capsid protein HK97 [Magnetospirillum sp. XM-1]